MQTGLRPVAKLGVSLATLHGSAHGARVRFVCRNVPRVVKKGFAVAAVTLKDTFKNDNGTVGGCSSGTFSGLLTGHRVVTRHVRDGCSNLGCPSINFVRSGNLKKVPCGPKANGIGNIGQGSTSILVPTFLTTCANGSPGGMNLATFPSLGDVLPG